MPNTMSASFLHKTAPLLALICLAFAGTAAAQVYTWKDANGRVHFSDQPPSSADVKPTRPASGPRYAPANPAEAASEPAAAGTAPQPKAKADVPAVQSGPKTLQEKELEMKQRRAAEQEAEAKRKEEQTRNEEKKRYCEGLKSNIALFERGGRITQTDAKGERNFLNEAQIKQELERARAQLARDCK